MTKKGSKKKTIAPKTDDAPKKAKQMPLPGEGMQRKRIAELDKAAEFYRAARNVRQEHTKKEKEAKTLLMACAKKHGVDVYVYEDEEGEEFEVEYSAEQKENIKVSKIARDEADE